MLMRMKSYRKIYLHQIKQYGKAKDQDGHQAMPLNMIRMMQEYGMAEVHGTIRLCLILQENH